MSDQYTMKKAFSSKFSGLIQSISERLVENKPVRRKLPVWGRVHIDRQLPFLFIHRQSERDDDKSTVKFAQGEASHLLCSSLPSLHPELSKLTRLIAQHLVRQFGACLILEIWAMQPKAIPETISQNDLVPAFRIIAPTNNGTPISSLFSNSLCRIKIDRNVAQIVTQTARHYCPEKLSPLLSSKTASEIGCHVMGIEISPVYLDSITGEVFPDILGKLNRQFSVAIHRALFNYTREFTTDRPPHYHSLGRRALVKAVWEVDHSLARVSDSLDLLLNITPVNARSSWSGFKRSSYEKAPRFNYRPLPVDPVILKRQLYKAPVTRIEDPALSNLFREKMEELDRQINMLQDRDTPQFLHSGFQVYGGVDKALLKLAEELLKVISPRCREATGKSIDAKSFAELARREIKTYRDKAPDLKTTVEIRDDIIGLMVSRGNLQVSDNSKIPAARAQALIQHEVGTHALTYHNGRSQPFQQLYSGLAGCDALQEGLAVFGEYMVGGLNRPRMRQIAGRVVAVHYLLDGASFVENFRELTGKYGFGCRSAFGILVRVYRSGGLTKDAVYLRGLKDVVNYLHGGGNLDLLYIGKIGLKHISIVQELLWRQVLMPPPLLPHYLAEPDAQERLKAVRNGLTVIEMIRGKRK